MQKQNVGVFTYDASVCRMSQNEINLITANRKRRSRFDGKIMDCSELGFTLNDLQEFQEKLKKAKRSTITLTRKRYQRPKNKTYITKTGKERKMKQLSELKPSHIDKFVAKINPEDGTIELITKV